MPQEAGNRDGEAEMGLGLFDLHDRVALVTGGAGGLGRAIAVGLAAAGAIVAVADTALAAADEILAEMESHGRRGLALPMDVTDAGSVQAVVDRLQSEWGRIDVLVTSHGITRRMPAVEFPEAEWDRIIAVNLKGAFLCCQIVGAVLFLASAASAMVSGTVLSADGGYTAQ